MTKEKVMQILKKQDEVSERIFMMRAYEEHSFTQIAQMMGMNQGAVKARYYKTVKLIRKELEGYEWIKKMDGSINDWCYTYGKCNWNGYDSYSF